VDITPGMPKTIEGNSFGMLGANQDSPECFRRHGSRGPRQMAQLFAFHPSAIEIIPSGLTNLLPNPFSLKPLLPLNP
jgi:hypothetical protein